MRRDGMPREIGKGEKNMGLDMYITAERYMSKYIDPEDEKKIEQINSIFGIDNPTEDYRVQTVIFNVAYWRKANAIHRWFVQNVQGGVDECQKTPVTEDNLKSLVNVCKEVLSDHKKAKKLLPAQSGFFFGSTEYDDGYYSDLQDTVDQIEKLLNDSSMKKADLYYRSSW